MVHTTANVELFRQQLQRILSSAEFASSRQLREYFQYLAEAAFSGRTQLEQAEIAEEMNLSTSKVNRIIAQARRSGMVKISIETPFQRLMDIERQGSRNTIKSELKAAFHKLLGPSAFSEVVLPDLAVQ